MFHTASCKPGGSVHINLHVLAKVPQKHGHSKELMCEFMDEMVALIDGTYVSLCGNDRFCTSLNLPGFPGLSTMALGKLWNGPRTASMSSLENGPSHLPTAISLVLISLKASLCCRVLSLLGGV